MIKHYKFFITFLIISASYIGYNIFISIKNKLLLLFLFFIVAILYYQIIIFIKTLYNENKKYKIETKNLIFKNKILSIAFNLNNHFIQDHTDNIFQQILKEAVNLVDYCDNGSFLIYQPESYSFKFKAVYGYDFDNFKDISIGLDETFIYRNSDNEFEEPVVIENWQDHNSKYMDNSKFKIFKASIEKKYVETLSIPIKRDDTIYGIINFDAKKHFSKNEIDNLNNFAIKIGKVIENNELLEKTIYLSKYDKLTNIYNRSYFEEVFSIFAQKSLRHNTFYSFILIDINYLKKINDNFGHNAGDQALKFFVNNIKKYLEKNDIFARLGGDEFVIILNEKDFEESNSLMETILQEFLKTPFYFKSPELKIDFPLTYSYGIASAPQESMVFDILLRLADNRMYNYKENFKKEHPEIIPTKKEKE